MGIKIITDSTADINGALRDELNVDVCPLSIMFKGDEQVYLDQVNLTNEEFYQRLELAETLPVTSQIPTGKFCKIFDFYLKQGDELVGIFLSSKLSGTYQTAIMAKEMFPSEAQEKIHIIDSEAVTLQLGNLVCEAVRLKNEGLSGKEIKETLDQMKKKNILYAVIGDLKYLTMGGRLSKASANIGTILHINPVIKLENGEITLIQKLRGKRKAYQYIKNIVSKDNVDYNKNVFVGHTNNPGILKDFWEIIKDLIPPSATVKSGIIGSVVGTHGGPNCTGITYFRQ